MLKIFEKNIHQSWFVVAMCVGVILGVILALVGRISFFASPIWLILAGILLIFVYFEPKMIFIILALVAGMILAFFKVADELKGEDFVRQFYGQTVTIVGEVDGDPETDVKGTKIKLKNLKFDEGELRETKGSIFISAKQNEEIKRSDSLTLKGKLSEGFGVYVGYMYRPVILKIQRPEPGDLILKVRNWFAERIEKLIPEPEVNLGLSYLLGMRAGLPENLAENLRIVGLVHIVVASGAHLSILVEIARKIFGKISRFGGLLFSILFIVFFMSMVGWTPSIMRAGTMAILTLLAWYVGRKFAAWRIILLVAAGTLLYNPMYIINLGWLLSFASFGGIMILGPKMAKFFYGEKQPGFVSSVIITTIAATLMTLPITLYFFGTVSLISVIANLLILPTLPYAMGLVFLMGVVSGVPLLETVVSFLATKLLDFHIGVVNFFGEQVSFLVKIEPGQWWVFLFYVVIFLPLVILLLRRKMLKLREVEYKF